MRIESHAFFARRVIRKLVEGRIWGDLAFVTVLCGAGSAIVGGIVSFLRKPPNAIRPGAPEIWGRLANRFSQFVRAKLAPGSKAFRHGHAQPDAI